MAGKTLGRTIIAPNGEQVHISYIVDPGADKIVNEGDDLRMGLKKTLASYLSTLTKSPPHDNIFPVDSDYEEFSLSDDQGDPSALKTGGSNDDPFSTHFSLDQYSNSGLFDDSNDDGQKDSITLSTFLEKGKDGHFVLKNIRGTGLDKSGKSAAPEDDGSLVGLKVSTILLQNRFNPSPGTSPFVTLGTTRDVDVDSRPFVSDQTSFGEYDRNAKGVTMDRLKKVGLSLMLRAVGDDRSSEAVDPDNVSFGALVPSPAQVGVGKIDPSDLHARSAFGATESSKRNAARDISLDVSDPEQKSHGNLNSFLEPFNGFAPVGMIALSLILTIGLSASLESIFGILSGFKSDSDSVDLGLGPHKPGHHGKIPTVGGTLSQQLLGIVQTKHNYPDAVNKGINVFYGFTGNLSSLLTASARIAGSPGFYAIVNRAVLRSVAQITDEISDALTGGNPLETAQALLGLVDVIRRSKAISFINALATLGDIALEMESTLPRGEDDVDTIIEGKADKISSLDDLEDIPIHRVGKSRGSKTSLPLVWRNSATDSMYVLPREIVIAATTLTEVNVDPLTAVLPRSGDEEFMDRFLRNMNESRISKEDVKFIEDRLDSEYVPFYFHDLRTNEIISFHAFLNTLTDGYTANYETNLGYGRVDPVMIYSNTQRSINLSFYVAATSPDDFDAMWWKINKLMTLVYPQWSEGRKIETADGHKFIQPFSQVLAGSPVVRIRLGDLLRSNYSKFSLARLFGLGTESFNPIEPAGVDDLETIKKVQAAREMYNRMFFDPNFSSDPSKAGYQVGDQAILLPSLEGYPESTVPSGNILKAAVSAITGKNKKRYMPVIAESKIEIIEKITETVEIDGKKSSTTSYVASFIDPPEGISFNVVVSFSNLRPDLEYIKMVSGIWAPKFNVSSPVSLRDQLGSSNFFSSDENVIVRSFESTRGRGLAGVIKSLNFDWTKTTWEIELGSRAPKICLINIDFQPIHDIAPGLDSSGFNRAPIYNVGKTTNSVASDPYADGENAKIRGNHIRKVARRIRPGSVG